MLPWAVSFCAMNGAGKTTQAKLLERALTDDGTRTQDDIHEEIFARVAEIMQAERHISS